MSTKTVHDAHIRTKLPALHRALIEIVGVMNRPERDEAMLKAAGLTLERALFPLLVLVERLGPIGVVDLASRVGRDHTTVSRQIARLAELGLVARHGSAADRRVREATITPPGKEATDAVDRAREAMAVSLFRNWSETDFDQLVRLIGMLAESMTTLPPTPP
ncbi:MarR family winged helix-turn-helix transcriptional regulator [Gluconacetobacter takamatsuzukensis]|uniref:MarR family transcriptional regulator n=1 Tax=Gluconacetobacter takamatsuzukensis TaxID=1286190 RepID=A0A7W4KF48_9PROT|nr:MarR family transcriptional regulator [Gluconacetobacter takamatsuzukensis]MBB2205680.1 MarR family transcriptional regulator [Gluconacetobacter takamatsuzukensis]